MRAADGGHDGLIVRDTDGSISTLSVFRPEQIKSAAANQGTFDPSNPSILNQSLVDEATGLPINPDGTVTVYHHTNADAAEAIRSTGRLKSAGEPAVYVTTRREADTGYGDTEAAIAALERAADYEREFGDSPYYGSAIEDLREAICPGR